MKSRTHHIGLFLLIMLCVAGGTLLSYKLNGSSWLGVDDANIYFIYMKNLASGQGFVYQQGGEAVEGFTSLLWTLTGALVFLFTHDAEPVLLIINILMCSLGIFCCINFFERRDTNSSCILVKPVLLTGLVLLMPGFIDWCVLSLMDTGLWCLLLTLCSLSVLGLNRDNYFLSRTMVFTVLMILLLLCRPEAMLWSLVFIGLRWLYFLRRKGHKTAFRSLLIVLPVWAVTLAALTVWRLQLFAYPLPNTWYAKVSPDLLMRFRDGFFYVYDFFTLNPLMILLCGLLILAVFRNPVNEGPGSRATEAGRLTAISMLALTGVSVLIPWISGGDHFGHFRFFQPSVPVYALAVISVTAMFRIRITPALAFLILLFAGLSSPSNVISIILKGVSPVRHEWAIAADGRVTSGKLNVFFADLGDYPSQGVLEAGGRAYAYKGKSIDLMGLNEPAMAHAPRTGEVSALKNHAAFNSEVFYRLQPDLFWIGGGFSDTADRTAPDISRFSAAAFRDIHKEQAFCELYTACMIIRKDQDEALKIYARRSFLKNLPEDIYEIIIF